MSAQVSQNLLVTILSDSDQGKTLVKTAQEIGDALVKAGLSTAQIRNIFGMARQIQARWSGDTGKTESNPDKHMRELMLLQPKLEYQAVREQPVSVLKDWLIPAIDLVYQLPNDSNSTEGSSRYERFSRFMDFFEAILAYHSAKGGKQDKGRQ